MPGEDRRRAWRRGQEAAGEAAVLVVVGAALGLDDLQEVVQPLGLHRADVAALAVDDRVDGAVLRRLEAEEGDAPVALLDQVRDGQEGALLVVVVHRVEVAAALVAPQDHDRHRGGQPPQVVAVEHWRDQHEAVDLAVEQGLDQHLFVLVGTVADGEQRLVLRALQRAPDAVEDVREERVAHVGHHDTERVGASAQATGRHLRAVVQLGHRLLDAGAHLLAQPVGVAQHLGHGGA